MRNELAQSVSPAPARRGARALLAAGAAMVLGLGAAVPRAALADDREPDPARGDPAVERPTWEPTANAGDVPSEPVELDESAYDVPGRVVVDARDDLDEGALGALARAFGVSFEATELAAETRIQIAAVAPGTEAEVAARFAADPRVELAEPLARVRALFVPNDPLLKEQWHMERIGATRAWDFATGRGVTVAVVDTGIACETHGPFTKGTDLASTTCVPGWSFVSGNEHANDDQGHGTHVAGTIAQSTNNGLGAVGVAFHASLMPVKVLNESGWGSTTDVADGIRWAADHGAHVINLSLGGPRNSRVLQSAIDHAIARGVVVVAAAGNTGGRVQYPGASDGVIGVSATGPDDKLARFSSRGEGVDVAAPGVNVVQQTVCNRGRDKCERFPGYSGTSMAAPHVAGAAALVVSLGVTDPVAVEGAIRSSARVVDGSESGQKLFGAGILDAAAAAGDVTRRHAIARLVGVVLLSAWVARRARRQSSSSASPWSLRFLVPALAAGPGLLFLAPWILPRTSLSVDLLARPLADLDLLIGASLHRWLPLANALVPLGLTLVGFGVRWLRPSIAGLAVGTAAYLASIVALGDAAGPFGRAALVAWAILNVVGCLWIARVNLAETK